MGKRNAHRNPSIIVLPHIQEVEEPSGNLFGMIDPGSKVASPYPPWVAHLLFCFIKHS